MQVKAKAIRKYVDKMITLAKRGDLHARRQVSTRGSLRWKLKNPSPLHKSSLSNFGDIVVYKRNLCCRHAGIILQPACHVWM